MRLRWVVLLLAWPALAWGQGPPNPWVRPNCLLGHAPVADVSVTNYRWYVSATPGIVPDGTYTLQVSANTTSARCTELGLVAGQTRYLVVTAVNAGGESLASNELWIMISGGTVPVHP